MSGRTVPFTVRRLDDGQVFQLLKVFRRAEDRLADVTSPDGRSVYTPDEKNYFFEDEPNRPMQIPETD